MSRFIIVGEQGENDLLLIDKQTMTVAKVDQRGSDNGPHTAQSLVDARQSGRPVVKGISVAVAVEEAMNPSSRWVFQQA